VKETCVVVAAASERLAQAESGTGKAAPAAKFLSKRRLIVLAVPLLLAGVATTLWFTGVLPRMLGIGHAEKKDEPAKLAAPVYVELPDIVANLNGGPHRQSYLKLTARLELAREADVERVRAAMPRLQDLFQTYLREMRPEELRGSAGTYRLREELIGRANIAVAPARVTDVLFIQILMQ
jgi:flagellar FliL protein